MESKTVQKKKKEIQILTLEMIKLKILQVMKRHIGIRNSISKRQLFECVYGDVNNYTKLQIFFLWDRLKKVLNWIRRTTFCFIISTNKSGIRHYFVVTNEDEAEIYKLMLKKNIKKMYYMIERCEKSVEERWYSTKQW